MKNINANELLKGILNIGLYYILPTFLLIPFLFLKNTYIKVLFIYITLCLVFVIIHRKDLLKDLKDLKKNWKSIITTALLYWTFGVIASIVIANIINLFNIAPVINQESNIKMLKEAPVIEYIFAVILAPITEELVFRNSFRKSINNIHLYAFITGIIFAFIHVTTSLDQGSIMLVYTLVYLPLGLSFGYTFYKTKNIFSSMFIHSLHNVISLTLLLIVGGIL